MNGMSKYVRKNDIILLSCIAVLIFVSFGLRIHSMMNNGSTIEITVDGKVYGRYALEQDQRIPVEIDDETKNIVVIADGEAYMAEASCPDKLCIHQGRIESRSQSIVCLPNRVIVTVVDGEEPEIDSMTD
ncbi:MAG: NusG domain II-containing protein [Lachnospiraceae bacterium]|nr:NusG domain II-containing protein [Lachnospiraceae bacterium]